MQNTFPFYPVKNFRQRCRRQNGEDVPTSIWLSVKRENYPLQQLVDIRNAEARCHHFIFFLQVS